MRSLQALVLGVLVAAGKAADPSTCFASGLAPVNMSTKYALSFCTHFQTTRCCLPVHDNTIQIEYTNLIASNMGCAEMLNGHISSLSHVLCAACNPLSPPYLTPPVDSTFFSGPLTLKVCASLATQVAPVNFDQCGLSQQAYRASPCAASNPVGP
ncbi:Aste57867_24643 [Aphanomyces stellatus]|uniref:Aste57867_24643 protein n=1 Tax=Aphanomyces stellatus TaxID=120398 RepID=A0A485LR42_9STRA|nr:hypothetical protein As57867_024565 [Aphanomyces stellatus]VFU01280.1 Aste57867_24643 [Aphanomyces stellatus]